MRRLGEYRLGLLLDTAARVAFEEPSRFASEVCRRLLPSGLRTAVGSLGQHVGTSTRAGSALRTALGTVSGRLDLVGTDSALSASARSRQLWERGEVTAALAELEGGNDAVRRRLADDWEMICSGRALALSEPAVPASSAGAAPGSGLDVLHFLTNSLPYKQSGYTVRTQRLLAAQQQAGIRLEAVTRIGFPVTSGVLSVPDVSHVEGVRYRRLLPGHLERLPRTRIEQQARLLADYAREANPRVLHTTTDYRNGLTVEAAAHALGLPWVYEMRGQLEKSWVARQKPEYREAAEASERFLAWRATETRLATSADAVVVLSEVQREELVARGVDGEKIRIMPNAFDWPEGVERVSRPEARGLLGLPEADVWVGSVSAVVDYEGFDTLIRAVALLRSRGVDAKAAIVGDGASRPELEALARELEVDAHVLFPGRVPIDRSHLWYQALDLFAVPRRDTPVCRVITPIKPLEALACATPVLVSDLPALQLAPSHGAGLAIEPENPEKWANAISSRMPESAAYTRLSQAAAALAFTQSWSANARTSIEMYREIS